MGREVGGAGRGSISNSHKIISLWIISVSKLKSLATDGHLEQNAAFEWLFCFLLAAALVPSLASLLLPTAWPSFLQAGLPVALSVLYLDLRIQQPKALPSGECVHGEAGIEVLVSPFHHRMPQNGLPQPHSQTQIQGPGDPSAGLRPHRSETPSFACHQGSHRSLMVRETLGIS